MEIKYFHYPFEIILPKFSNQTVTFLQQKQDNVSVPFKTSLMQRCLFVQINGSGIGVVVQ